MRTAIYIENGVTQVVLTPETDAESRAIDLIKDANTLKAYKGGFYACQVGWYRENETREGIILCATHTNHEQQP